MTISFDAYKKFGAATDVENDLTADMRFFIAYAGVWAQNIRSAEELRLTKVDEHSLGRNRVNGILPHINAWYDAF
ncbi:MAG: M13 family peptidase, partial [Alphaproteobacteria bacterium]|nr:M13 family peptidase [Alphaproteobacteria bacterium]